LNRLDLYLVKNKSILSRAIAKFLIKEGFISINGKICKKPSFKIKYSDEILILTDHLDKSQGFWKLTQIEKEFPFLSKDMKIIDLGSSKGGFLEYCAINCKAVLGVEISKDFQESLLKLQEKYSNVKIFHENIFEWDINIIKDEKFDCILNDLTLNPFVSFDALIKILPLLKNNGTILFSIKLGNHETNELEEKIEQQFLYNNLFIIKKLNIDKEKREFHYILEKRN